MASKPTVHGAPASGLGKAKLGGMGIYGQQGTKNEQDLSRKTSSNAVGSNGVRGSSDGNPGVKSGRTGGMNRKFAGVVGAQKATGTK